MLEELSSWAWDARNRARLRGTTAVGAAVSTTSGAYFTGANIELEFRTGMHAEVVALAAMAVSSLRARANSILVAAERDFWMPCGGCLDWIIQLGGAGTLIIAEKSPGVKSLEALAGELMPRYPH